MQNKFIFFWGGIYSQWQPSEFVIDGVNYNCCEQYMMAKKALLFNDTFQYDRIMDSSDPSFQKSCGKLVKNFDKVIWENVCRDIVYDANYAKFTQNPEFGKELRGTSDIEIVEASPEDKIWGIGLHESDPRVWDKSKWLGTNWLGEAIMKVRTKLNDEYTESVK
jgi:ribA/ribD-fused uncharacterized protein